MGSREGERGEDAALACVGRRMALSPRSSGLSHAGPEARPFSPIGAAAVSSPAPTSGERGRCLVQAGSPEGGGTTTIE